ncbi:hypothetical protein D3C74_91320 [compost metagenome]
MWGRRSLEKVLIELNTELQLPYGPKIKSMSDEKYQYFMRVIPLMSKEELAAPQDITPSRILDLTAQSGVKEDHIKSLVLYFELRYMKGLSKDPKALMDYYKNELNERGLRALNDLQ